MPTANDMSHNMVLVYFTAAKPTVYNPKYTYSCQYTIHGLEFDKIAANMGYETVLVSQKCQKY
jgi:hypothetical protein